MSILMIYSILKKGVKWAGRMLVSVVMGIALAKAKNAVVKTLKKRRSAR